MKGFNLKESHEDQQVTNETLDVGIHLCFVRRTRVRIRIDRIDIPQLPGCS